ncbi:MAG: hypothetical protein NTX25_03685 [Proteobacteria bacterium]|nr:hypothetical protein [Pseudomonadota bacterium]
MNKKKFAFFLLILSSLASSPIYANWTFNLGYHNPMNAKFGLNLLYWGSQWNFEAGVGWFDGDVRATDDKNETNKDDDGVSVALAGDINFKYRFSTATVAPYLQIGLGASTGATVGDNNDAGANLGGPFIGAGLMLGKPNLYGYAAYNISSSQNSGQFQAGLGFDI